MDYDVVIATKNRPEALRLSIPLILGQEHPPKKLIIVDASDEHQLIRRAVKKVVGACPVELVILNSQPNLARQRNIGLKYVEAPVVMFPDDDSLWFPGYAEAIMHVYERDAHGDIGGVGGVGVKEMPSESSPIIDKSYNVHKYDRFARQIDRFHNKMEEVICPNPFVVHGQKCWSMRLMPDWLGEENAVPVEYIVGYRMSFRTDAIRKSGFDEDMGYHIGWAVYEDVDACFSVMRDKLCIVAHDAKVYHHKFPSKRAGGFKLGFFHIFNQVYVISKYAQPGSAACNALKRYATNKLLQYAFGICSKFGRQRMRGARLALKYMRELLEAPQGELRQRYLELCKKAMLLCDHD